MKFSIAGTLVATAALMDAASAVPVINAFSGFNLGANKPDGSCKNVQDWTDDFNTIKSWDSRFNTVKLFTTSDCGAIMNAAPAAIATGMKIWVGVWAVDTGKFDNEKGNLEAAMREYGNAWMAGVNVGSESLYRKEIDPKLLAQRIYDVKGMVQGAYGASQVAVGSADTWTAWVDPANEPVIDACDVIVMNAFPYWQGAKIENAPQVFRDAVANTRSKTKGKPFVVGETGWPTDGPNFGDATATVPNLQAYWSAIGCELRRDQVPNFWFSGFDEPGRESAIEKNFGIAKADKSLKISLSC